MLHGAEDLEVVPLAQTETWESWLLLLCLGPLDPWTLVFLLRLRRICFKFTM